MYVCMGNTCTTDTQAWVSHARLTLSTDTTSATVSHSNSAVVPPGATRPTSGVIAPGAIRPTSGVRPTSAVSLAVSGADSGFHSTMDSAIEEEAMDLKHEGDRTQRYGGSSSGGGGGSDDITYITPRPSDTVCHIAEGANDTRDLVYASTVSPQWEIEEQEPQEEDAKGEPATTSQTFGDIHEAGAVVVGTVLRHAIAEVSGQDMRQVSKNPHITSILPDQKWRNLNMSSLNKLEYLLEGGTASQALDRNLTASCTLVNAQITKHKNNEDDDDSLLDSDDDYDSDRDGFFRRHKEPRSYSMDHWKGIAGFKKFLQGTTGEKHWHLWQDIERGGTITSHEDLTR